MRRLCGATLLELPLALTLIAVFIAMLLARVPWVSDAARSAHKQTQSAAQRSLQTLCERLPAGAAARRPSCEFPCAEAPRYGLVPHVDTVDEICQ